MKKIVPLITCAIHFCQHVFELVFGVKVTDLNFRVQINHVKQPIQSSSVGPWNMRDFVLGKSFWLPPHRPQSHTTSNWDQNALYLVECDQCVEMTFVCLIGMGFRMFDLTTDDGYHRSSLLGPSVLFGTEWNTSITKSQRSRQGIPSMRKPASREMISTPAELCETEVCFLHIQLFGTNVWLPKVQDPFWCWFWVFKVSCKIRVLK